MNGAYLTHEQWQEKRALNFVAPYLRNRAHRLHLDTASGRVWLDGPAVDEQAQWVAQQLAPYAPALARIMRRQMAERVSTENSHSHKQSGAQ